MKPRTPDYFIHGEYLHMPRQSRRRLRAVGYALAFCAVPVFFLLVWALAHAEI